MKIKFNKFERVAGAFVGFAILGSFAIAISVAVKQGWFDRKIPYVTIFENAEGVHPGTIVQMAGIKVGSVEEVDLQNDDKIRVVFNVLEKYSLRVKKDSKAQLVRPFIIGDRVLDVIPGSASSQTLAAGEFVTSHEAVDMMGLLSGKKLGPYLESISGMFENLRTVAEAFLDKERTQSFVKMFDRIDPLMRNLNVMVTEVIKMAKQANKDENLGTVLANIAVTTNQLNAMLPAIQEQAPEVARNMTSIVENMAVLTKEFKVILPALSEVAPDLPHASRRAVEALDEAVVLLKAMKKSMFLKGNVEDVKEEEAVAEQKRKAGRSPASKEGVRAPQGPSTTTGDEKELPH